MSRIFISYRRDDTAGHAGRLADVLAARFGEGSIFRDIEAIRPGEDFVAAIDRAIEGCDALVVVIGREWLDADAGGSRRLDDPDDAVRREIAAALERNIGVLPVLVEGARMPRSAELPEDITSLGRRNALVLSDIAWQDDVDRLVAALRDMVAVPARPIVPQVSAESESAQHRARNILLGAGAGVVAITMLLLFRGDAQRTSDLPSPMPASESAGGSPAATASEDPVPDRIVALGIPAGVDFELGRGILSLRGARILEYETGRRLAIDVRFTNLAEVDLNFWSDSFRLITSDERLAPVSELNELVAGGATANATVLFDLPPDILAVTLRLIHQAEYYDVFVDLREWQRVAVTAPPQPVVVGIDLGAPPPVFDVNALEITVQSASLRRYVNKNVLTFSLRVAFPGNGSALFDDRSVLIQYDDVAYPPADAPSLVLPPGATLNGDVVFELPINVTTASLVLRDGEASATLPLTLPIGDR